jgi:Tol biopolymer transport system component
MERSHDRPSGISSFQNTSSPSASHGHPRFSPDDRWVIYNSDVEKSDNVYMADVGSV